MSPAARVSNDGSLSNLEIIREDNQVNCGLSYSGKFISEVKEGQNRHRDRERGRRSRLHAALNNLQEQLPPDNASVWKNQRCSNRHQQICKANTIEAATAYISLLKQEIEQLKTVARAG